MSAEERADVVIIGSGFGGAVAACRLSGHGRSVVVLERGRDWSQHGSDHPRPEENLKITFCERYWG